MAHWRQRTVSLLLSGVVTMVIQSLARAGEEAMITAVASKTSGDYVRLKLSDGSYAPETYAFGKGGFWSGMHDDSIDKLKFIDVARTIAGPLANQNYAPSKDPGKTKLLVMLYWGSTTVPPPISGSALFGNLRAAETNLQIAMASGNRELIIAAKDQVDFAEEALQSEYRLRNQADWRNAWMLGYDSKMEETGRFDHTVFQYRRDEVINDIEENRYFVVLMAYDFQLQWKQKKHKLLWETRFSIQEHRNDFKLALPTMAQEASRYFGQDSHGLVRRPLPEGHVTLGEPKVLEYEPEKK